ncbi:GNAT family N-acetyltransferase [Halosolutus amylolyticus]|uniref:GNAT family N-acetyltransferase n=1 Tax=Halosolutus amylolyticus TaxID=2932267 RepID=A0ABD5PUL6_9EURY|nr:GNAT family N-acetyltransferase [Halosolutus amylolyticus]
MKIRRLPSTDSAVRRFAEDLWLPYHRELEATVDAHALADDVDLVAEEVPFRLERLESEGYRAWVAVDATGDEGDEAERNAGDSDLADGDAVLAGFVTTEIDETPTVFDRPDQLVVGDIYVRDPYRGTGLARDLIDRAAERARAADCPELVLDVDVDNERAVRFYEALGFETARRRLRAGVDEVSSDP